MLTKSPYLCTHQFCHMAKSICRMNWHSALTESVGTFFIRWWICPGTERISHWFQKSFAFLKHFYAWVVSSPLSLGTSLRSQHLRSFKCYFNEYLLHLMDIQQHKTPDCSAKPSCKCAEKSDVSQQRHNAAHNSQKQIFLLSVFCENSLHQKGFCSQESFVFCKVLSLLWLQHFRVDKRLLFIIYVVVAYFISFKPERKSSC